MPPEGTLHGTAPATREELEGVTVGLGRVNDRLDRQQSTLDALQKTLDALQKTQDTTAAALARDIEDLRGLVTGHGHKLDGLGGLVTGHGHKLDGLERMLGEVLARLPDPETGS